MRILKTFVLRLLMDSETPHVLRGAVRAIANDEDYTFTDGQTLLALLYEISQAALRGAECAGTEGTTPRDTNALPSEREGEGGGDKAESWET